MHLNTLFPLVLSGCLASASSFASDALYDFNIEAGPLARTLISIGQVSGRQVLFVPADVEGRQARALRGQFSSQEAVRQSLQGSGLALLVTASGALSVQPLNRDGLTLDATVIDANRQGATADEVIARRTPAASTTRLGLSNRETPQAISTVTRQQIDDFKLTSVKDALRSAPTVTVEQFETDRTAFTSRGFIIDNFEYDGMGMPFSSGVLLGDQDLAEFEQIDVLHGANGLMSGAGNPSATVNAVRKRPTETFQAQINSSVGSWDNRRLDFDVSGPLSENGKVRGRFIYAHDKGNSYLDRYSHEINLAAGLLAFDLSAADTLTVGYSDQKSNSNGSTWGALPIADYAGNRIHYSSRSSSIGQPWSYWNIHTQRAFAEWIHEFDGGWKSTLTVTGVNQHQDTQMLYAIPATATDVFAYVNRTTSTEHQLTGELQLAGPFNLFGREHELTLGANYGRSRHDETGHYQDASGYIMASLTDALAGRVVKPPFTYTDSLNTQLFTDRQKSVYAGARFSLSDDLHWIAGARMLSADGDGMGYGSPHDTRVHGKVTPYTGVVYDLTAQWSLYASWTEIFKPQYLRSTAGGVIEPLEGKSTELGIKGSLFDDRLSLTGAVFKTDQQNVAETTGEIIGGQYAYRGVDFKSHGVELEAHGEALPGLELAGGYTWVRIEDNNGDKARRYVPNHTLRASLTWRLPNLPQAKVGSRVQWQSATEADSNSRVSQDAYTLVDLMASYDFGEHWSTSLNLNNLFDQKYLLSLYQTAGSTNYGAPRNVMASVSWKY
ncbi:TonB-dependent siderophore receptor [Pseudomonas sp. StFLB209]|uniref:TonB-dependent siderophore receptor n=1 Tax=Pseudomonas sp. StFLB209 TaxID=1028989 RepID=UPI0004F5E702|nr:TonB-dependent siderophore receptor [Pseudomonas sp. StFLB209]BAP40963.1 TonB-dependent siderophore receptor [Pseudomonas sp. StFLB209]